MDSPVPSGTESVHDTEGGHGQLGLRAGGARDLWVKKEPPKEGNYTKTYNVIILLRDERIQELEEELREATLVWDVIGIGEVRRRDDCFTHLQSGHMLFHSTENNGQAGVGFLINKK